MLRNLQAEMRRSGIKNIELASSIDVNEKTLRNKLSGKTVFTFPETEAIRDTFFPGLKLEYLFASEDDNLELNNNV